MERQTSSTQIHKMGMGPKKASLYLSRTSSLMKTKHDTFSRPTSKAEKNGENRSHSRASKLSQTSKKNSENFNKDVFLPPIQKEFTFTGYDIMQDVEPRQRTESSEEEKSKNDNVQYYIKSCNLAGLIPVTYLVKHINDPEVVMKSHPLGPEGTRALCIALVNNTFVQSLNLEDNDIGPDGCLYIVDMLRKNDTITHLKHDVKGSNNQHPIGGASQESRNRAQSAKSISENSIGTPGVVAFSDILKDGKHLHTLDISGSNLSDSDAKYVASIIEFNPHLRTLILHHNRLGDDGGFDIGRAIAINDTLKELDLSWNHIRGRGALALATGVQRNIGLHKLNVSWNGLGKSGSEGFGKALAENRTLLELNIANNRIGTKEISNILKGLQENDNLDILRVGQNPLSPEVALTILQAIEQSDKCALTTLDLTDVAVRSEFLRKWDELRNKRAMSLKIIFGTIVKSQEALPKDPNAIDWQDPITRMFKYMQDQGYRVIDLLKRLDRDRSLSVDREEFKRGLMSENVPLTEAQLDEIIERLDTDGDGEVDLGELLAGEREFRRRMHIRMRKLMRRSTTVNSVIHKLREIEEL